MAYIVNGARVASLTIGGQDYTNALITWSASDTSAFKTGCIVTTGSLVLGTQAGSNLESYRRDTFKRGESVVVTMTGEDGVGTYRHPRGLLYVVDHSYDPEKEEIEVSLACQLGLAALTGDTSQLVPLSPIALDVTQQEFSNISAAFASAGQYLYQDNTGALQSGEFFDGDTTAGVATGEWLSIDSVTAISVQPLSGSDPVPDRIKLQYQVPTDGLNSDQKGKIETVTTISNYFLDFPGISYTRSGDPSENTNSENTDTGGSSGGDCGNEAPYPGSDGGNDSQQASCSSLFDTVKVQEVIPATKTQIQTSYYDGPGGQQSRTYTSTTGPGIEINSQYYGDKYAYCRALYASKCDPNGNCPMEGLAETLMGWDELLYYYGPGGELVKTVQDTYVTTLSAAQSSDWRANYSADTGFTQFNQSLPDDEFYHARRTVVEYYKEGNANVQLTTNYDSVASKNVGITTGADLSCLSGIVTTTKRISTTTATLEEAPDRVNSPSTDTTEQYSDIRLFTGRYVDSLSEAGPYSIDESIPVAILLDNASAIEAVVDKYSNYLVRMYKGEAFGVQLTEVLRDDIVNNWRPGMPFRFYDAAQDELLALRMDATTWNVSGTGSVVVTSGLWIGYSNGTVQIPSNIIGATQPDMGSGGGTAPPTLPPSVDNETAVDSGSVAFVVDVDMSLSAEFGWYGNKDGIVSALPTDNEFEGNFKFFTYVTGFVVEPGGLLGTGPNGSIPLEYSGSLILADAVVVYPDLFA